jgi:hypothetical protein
VSEFPATAVEDRRRLVWPVLGAIAATLFLIRLLGAEWPNGFPMFFPDSASYMRMATLGPFRPSFWFGERPVVTPLFYWSLGRNVRLAVLVQSLLYIASFWWAIMVVCRIARTMIGRAIAVVTLAAVAVQSRFAMWNTQILSESLSLSLSIAMTVAWLSFADRPTARRATTAWVFSALWAMTRDSNAIIVVVLVVPAALIAAKWWKTIEPDVRRRLRLGALALGLVACYTVLAQTASERSRYSTLNVIGQRVLVDDELTDYFVDHGMPFGDAVADRAGKNAFDDNSAMLIDPALAPLRSWVLSGGQVVHLWTMVRFAPRYVPEVWRDLPVHLGEDHVSYDLFGVSDRLPRDLPLALGGPRDTTDLTLWAVAAGAGLVAMVALRRRVRHGVVLATGLLIAGADAYVSWLGDSLEVHRHVMGAIARLSVVLALIVGIGVDRLVGGFRRDEPVDDAEVAYPESTATPEHV